MTPGQRAHNLLTKYCTFFTGYTDQIRRAKECAMIAIDNEQDALDRFADCWDLKNGEWYKEECEKIKKMQILIVKI